jgi:hypothetical protein
MLCLLKPNEYFGKGPIDNVDAAFQKIYSLKRFNSNRKPGSSKPPRAREHVVNDVVTGHFVKAGEGSGGVVRAYEQQGV